MSGPCLDVYAWVRSRDRSTITSFVDRFVDLGRGTGMMQDEIEIAPPDLPSAVPREYWDHRSGWESVHVESLDDVIRLGLEQPYRIFGLYLHGKDPWPFAMLNFTLDGGTVLGVSINVIGEAASQEEAERLAVSMFDRSGAQRAWVAYEEPAPNDPLAEEPWLDAIFTVGSDR